MKVYYLLVSALCVWTTPAHSQFFYSHYTPFHQIQPYFPQSFVPQLPAVSPLAYTVPASQPAPAAVTYNIPTSAEYRGFGYRTDYKDGASSTVFYVTGPEAENLRNFRDFPNFSRKIDESAGKARSLASDIIDVNAIPDAQGKIQSILKPVEFEKLFENVMPGVVNFYTFPAGTVPLALARQLNVTTNETTTTPATEEVVAAESIINPKVVVNNVDNAIKAESESTTVSEAPETGSTMSEASSTTTEAKSESSTTEASESKEKSTSSNEETTTVEVTTKV